MYLRKWTLLIVTLAFAGCCMPYRGATGNISGTVTLHGKPLSNAEITLFRKRAAGGITRTKHSMRTDSAGRYSFTSVLVGQYRAQISKVDPRTGLDAVPSRYTNASGGQLRFEVVAGNQTKDFHLPTKTRRPGRSRPGSRPVETQFLTAKDFTLQYTPRDANTLNLEITSNVNEELQQVRGTLHWFQGKFGSKASQGYRWPSWKKGETKKLRVVKSDLPSALNFKGTAQGPAPAKTPYQFDVAIPNPPR